MGLECLSINAISCKNDVDLGGIIYLRSLEKKDSSNWNTLHHNSENTFLDLFDKENLFWLAFNNKTPIGYCHGKINGSSFEAQRVYVLPEFRREKVASSLKKAQISFARKIGLEKISVSIYDGNIPSLMLQLSCGFQYLENSGINLKKYILDL